MENLSRLHFCSGVTVLNLLNIPLLLIDETPLSGPNSQVEPKPKRAGRGAGGNRVLLFGRLRELALYRAEVLSSRGFSVVTPRNKEEAKEAIWRGDFDVVVLTYTLSSETVEELADLLREHCPNCPLIAISDSAKVDRRIHPDETVRADDGPPALLAAIRKVLRRN